MKEKILITGASSIIGKSLIKRLQDQNKLILAVSRNRKFGDENPLLESFQWDLGLQTIHDVDHPLSSTKSDTNNKITTLVHCAPIWLLPKHLVELHSLGIKRVIAFSSTSIDSKSSSSNPVEQSIVQQLEESEGFVKMFALKANMQVTIFRPTMIYGYGQGLNLAFIAKMIQRFGFFPIVTAAKGLRRPVHADDLAKAVCLALPVPASFNKTYVLSGAKVMSYDEMVRAVFAALKRPIRIVKLPLFVYRALILLASKIAKMPMTATMAERMRENLDFDSMPAQEDFGYSPGSFLPNGIDDILQKEEVKN